MNYFTRHLLRDKQFWVTIGLTVAAALLSADMNGGVFKGLVVMAVIIAAFILLPLYYVRKWKFDKREEENLKALDYLEQVRRLEFQHRLDSEPGFVTMCYECRHFDQEKRSCSLDLPARHNRFVSLVQNLPPRFCLYWNIDLPFYLEAYFQQRSASGSGKKNSF